MEAKLGELAQKLQGFDLEELLDLAIQEIPALLGARYVSLYLIDELERNLVLRRHNHSRNIDAAIPLYTEERNRSLVPQVLDRGKPILIHDIEAYIRDNGLPIALTRSKYISGSCMLIPISEHVPGREARILGVLNLADRMDFSAFTKRDLKLASRVGDLLGNSIHNCRIISRKLGGQQEQLKRELASLQAEMALKKELDVSLEDARKKVEQLLPDLPSRDDYDIHCHYSPMDSIGGDFYDLIDLGEHVLGVVIADVSGHGIEAALVMSMTKQLLSLHSRLHTSLCEALVHTNEEVYRALDGSSFISIFFGILDTRTHVLRYVRAGHNPPLLYNASRQPTIQQLDAPGMVVGTTRGEIFRRTLREAAVQLESNDVLLLYTDGVEEAMDDAGEEFGRERLVEAIRRQGERTGDAAGLTRALRREVEQFSNAERQQDDITLLCLRARQLVREPVEQPPDDVLIIEPLGETAERDTGRYYLQPPAQPVDTRAIDRIEFLKMRLVEAEQRVKQLEREVAQATDRSRLHAARDRLLEGATPFDPSARALIREFRFEELWHQLAGAQPTSPQLEALVGALLRALPERDG